MENIEIIGTGMAVPSKAITNDDLAKIVDTSDDKYKNRYKESIFLQRG